MTFYDNKQSRSAFVIENDSETRDNVIVEFSFLCVVAWKMNGGCQNFYCTRHPVSPPRTFYSPLN